MRQDHLNHLLNSEVTGEFSDKTRSYMRPIPGTYGTYFVTRDGDVISFRCLEKPKKLSPGSTRGYKYVRIPVGGQYQTLYVHRLVAASFIPNYRHESQINHRDEDKGNNRIENLEYVSPADNINFGTRNQRVADAHRGHTAVRYDWIRVHYPDGHTDVYKDIPTAAKAISEAIGGDWRSNKTQISYCLSGRTRTVKGCTVEGSRRDE